MDDLENKEDANEIQRMSAIPNLGFTTVALGFAGMLQGGLKEASATVSKDAEVLLKMGSTTDKREQYRLMRDAMEKRYLRIARGSIVGGVRLGMFGAGFCALQIVLAEQRGVHDVYNIVAAGSATAATCGLIMPGSLISRASTALMGAALGAALGFPFGWLHLKLVEMQNQHLMTDYVKERETAGVKRGGVGAAIDRLEGKIK